MKRKMTATLLAGAMALGVAGGALAASAEESRTFTILSMWAEDDGDSGSLLSELTANYQAENPDFQYEIQIVSSDNLARQVATLAASNDLPDVFAYDPGSTLIELINAGLIIDISEKLDELGISDQINTGAKDFLTTLSETDDLYDLPLGQNIEGFWYNKALFEEAGISDVPTTWDEMLEDAQILLDAGIQPFAVGGADLWPATRYLNAYVMRKAGVDFMNDCYAGNAKYTDEALVEAATVLQDMVAAGYFGAGATTVDNGTAQAMIMNGEAAMIYTGSWYISSLNSEDNAAGEDGIGFFNIPLVTDGVGTLEEYSMNCGTVLALSSDKYDEVTAGWLEYFVTNMGDYAMNTQGSFRGYTITEMPEEISTYTQLVSDEMEKATASSAWFEAAMDTELSQIAQENVQSLMNGDMTPEEYCQSLQDIYDVAH